MVAQRSQSSSFREERDCSLHMVSAMSASRAQRASGMFFFLRFIYLFIGQSDIQRGGKTERKIFHPMIHSPSKATADAMLIQSQEPLPGLPHGCRVPKLWAIFNCLSGPQAGSWMGSWAAEIRTSAHVVSKACKARTLTTAPSRRALGMFFCLVSSSLKCFVLGDLSAFLILFKSGETLA